MGRMAKALCAAGALLALALPASAGAAFGPVGSFGETGSGNGQFNHPQGAAATDTQVVFADTGNARVEMFNNSGGFIGQRTFAGISPQDVAIAPNGDIYTASPTAVDAWGLLGLHIAQWAPPGTSYGIAIDSTPLVYVSDTQNGVIRKYNLGGAPQGEIGAGVLSQPLGLTAGPAGSVYVADSGNSRIVRLSSAGDVTGVWTMPSYTIVANGQTFTGRLAPHDVALDGSGRLFAPDAGVHSNLVAVFGADGVLQQVFGSPDSDPGNPCQLRSPWGLTASPAGGLYVVSTGENAIRVFAEGVGVCPTPDFGPGGGIVPAPGSSASDKKRPKIKLRGVPKKCARHNFTFRIRATDDVLITKLLLFINHERVAKQKPNRQNWTVKVDIPVRKIRRQLPRGTSVRVLIQVKAVDGSGKKAKLSKSFRICG